MFELDPRLNNDTLVLGEFPLSQLLLVKDKRYPWCILVPKVAGITEIYQLSMQQQQQLTLESALVAQTLMQLFKGDSMNIAALGNVVSQLHLHHVVRYQTDACWPGPIWGIGTAQSYQAVELNDLAMKMRDGIGNQLNFSQ
ncbi:MAG: HIT domain-containing protein [Psychrobium sp.]|nr:HIT domain-containing protein [Psychrobium sp.]